LVALAAAGPAHGGEFPCLIEPYVLVNASTAVEGILDSVSVKKGDLVEQGQVVATLESAAERAALEHARARAEQRAAVQAREVRAERARKKYKRALELSGEKFVSPDELDELKSAATLAELELEAELENRRLAELEVRRVAALYAMRFIRSPIRGVVVERFLSAGEFAQAQPIMILAQVDPLNVEVVLPSAYHGRVRDGMRAVVRPEEPVGGRFEASVTLVERVIDAASGTFGVRLELANPNYSLPSGLECRVDFPDL
jgi:RND family efflux transporter MFP subunit